MEKYVLLGNYEVSIRMNVEVIAADDNIENLKIIRDAINRLNEILAGECRYKPKIPEVADLLKNYLSILDIIDDTTDYIHEINPVGIFELKEAC